MDCEQFNMDYEQVNEALSENNWKSFKSTLEDLMIEESAVDKDKSGVITSPTAFT